MSTLSGGERLDMEDINAALHLEGQRLPGGWTVGQRNQDRPSGGRFSVSYQVVSDSGRRGFLKVLDLVSVFGDLSKLSATLADFLVERDLLLLCGAASMSRVVMAIDHGSATLDGYMPPLSTVHYIIFEHADGGDLSDALSSARLDDMSIRLQLVHDYAVGLRQLHMRNIAHQDVKPDNSLIFPQEESRVSVGKVADLGRAYQAGVYTSYEEDPIPGDRSFAPPEQLYGYQHNDISTRRFGADLYQLGSLMCFTFSGVTMNALLAERLAPEHHWDRFDDGYIDALPYVQNAYADAIRELRDTLPPPIAVTISTLVEGLCEPEAGRRGHYRARAKHGSRFSLERVIADLNLAEVRMRVQGENLR